MANTNKILLKINDLDTLLRGSNKKSYVMNDGSMIINHGDMIGIVGESGSGKTQLLKTATGTQEMNPGIINGNVSIYTNGKENTLYSKIDSVYSLNKSHKKIKRDIIGFIPQDPKSYLHPYWTLKKLFNQTYKLKGRKISLDSFAINFLKQVDIDYNKFKNKTPSQLSGGESQRVMIALVLSKEPLLIIADESTTGLDVSRQRKVIDTFKRIKKNNGNLSMIFISHDFGFLTHLVNEYYVLYGGFICEHIKNKNLLSNMDSYHPYTQDLITSLFPDKNKMLHDELSANISLENKLEGCPYISKCKHLKGNNNLLKNKCTKEIPSRMHNNKKIKDISKEWKRCWHEY